MKKFLLYRLITLFSLCLGLFVFPAAASASSNADVAAPTQITFSILNTCGSGDTYNFFLNGTSIGSVGGNPSGGCTCTPGLQTFTVNNAALLAGAWNSNDQNTLRVTKSGTSTYFAWVSAKLDFNTGSTRAYYAFGGGDATETNLCTAKYGNNAFDQVLSSGTFYRDADGDGFGDPNNFLQNKSLSPGGQTPPIGYVTNDKDCNDSDPNIPSITPCPCKPFAKTAPGLGFTQEMVASIPGTSSTSGYAFDSHGNIYTLSLANSHLMKIDLSTSVPGPGGVGVVHPVTDLGVLTYRTGSRTGQTTGGLNFTQYPDGTVYLNGNIGVVQVDLETASITSEPLNGGSWGIIVDPQLNSHGHHNIITAGGNVIDPVDHRNLGNCGVNGDGIAIDATGNFFFAAGGMRVYQRVLPNPASDVPVFKLLGNYGGNPDGMAFGVVGTDQVVVSNDGGNGTVTMWKFPNNDFTQRPTPTVIASGPKSGEYGDQANVGPDGYFYITYWSGTVFPDCSTNGNASIVRFGPAGRFLPPTHSDNISLTPASDTKTVGASEVLTATQVTTDLSTNQTVPVANTSVTFNVVGGPDMGQTFTGTTDANGKVTFTLVNRNGVGDDVVHAQFVDGNNKTQTSNNSVITFEKPKCTTPAFTNTPGNQTANTSANSCDNNVTYSASEVVTGSPSPAITYTFTGATTGSGTGNGSGSLFNKGTTTVTLTATNSCGSATCTFTVTVTDNTAPIPDIASLPDIVAECNVIIPNSAYPTATDNCSGKLIATADQQTSFFNQGTYKITWTYHDGNGNDFSQTQNVIVKDITPPNIINCVPNQQINLDATCAAVMPDYRNQIAAADNCTNSPALVITQSPAAGTILNGSGNIPVTFTVFDAVGLNSSCTMTLTKNDVTPPTLIGTPADVTVECSAVPTAATLTATDNCDASPIITYGEVSTQVSDVNSKGHYNYTLTRTWTATDHAGNASSKSQVVTVQDVTAPVLSAAPLNTTVECSAVPTAATLTATDNCDPSPIITYGEVSTQVSDVNSKGHYNYTLTRTWTATDHAGNASSKSQVVTVQDKTAPAMVSSILAPACNDLKGNTKTVVLTTSDNCSPVSSSYTLSGATVGSGIGTSVSQSFNIGTTTVTWKSSDVSGNTNSITTTVVVYPLPVASYTLSNQDNFCNKLYVNGASTLSGPFVYQWYGPASSTTPLATTQVLPLGVASTDGVYNLYTTDGNGCRSEKPATYTYKKDGLISTYTIVGFKEVDLGVNNTVLNGAVGVTALKGEAEMRSGVSIASTGAFLKAARIDIDGVVNIPTQIKSPAAPVLPTMIYNTTNTRSLPYYQSKTASVGTLSGNYSYVYLRAGSNVTLSGNTFGTIIAEKGATVLFTAPVVNIGNLSVGSTDDDHGDGDDKKTVTTTTTYSNIHFAGNTNVLVSGSVYLGLNTILNAENKKVSFYVGHLRTDRKHGNDEDGHEGDYNDNDETSFTVVGGDTKVTANVYAPNGEIHVQGSNKGEDSGWKWGGGDDDKKKAPTPTAPTYMTGIFIANQVESDSKGVIWNSFDCGTAGGPGFLGAPGNLDNQYVQQPELKGAEVKELTVVAAPNPTMNHFRLDITSNDVTTPVTVKVTDAVGRPLELFSKVSVGSSVSFGDRYTSGSYYALVLQGTQYKVVKLIKML